ncbi:hypothetical protein HBI84_191480 [Parastagonospora nodorum]|nr:hypothetical protein HBI84_191480 [Parastagonospora nodorum]
MSSTMTIEAIELQPLPSGPKPASEHSNHETITPLNMPSDPISEFQSLSKLQLTMTILQPSLVNFFGSFTSGIITVGLPIIASSISLQRSLYLWPASVYSLTCGAALLIAGSVADIIGPRRVEICGMFILGTSILACGFAQTGIQLVVFRAFQGLALAMHIPASVSIIANAVPAGRARNVGFSCLGLSQPLGFSFGMVLSGIMIERVGWRSGFYLCGAGILVNAVLSWIYLPKMKGEAESLSKHDLTKKLWTEVDWVGGIIAGSGLALLSYVFAMVSADLTTIRSATTASLLAISLVLFIAFPVWMRYRETHGQSALIPNSLWNLPFSSICALVALSYGAMNSMSIFCSLYFQEVQNHSPLIASLYLLPNLVIGVLINLSMGIFVDRLPAGWTIVVSSLLCAPAPLMMALVDPSWKYYYLELWAQILSPLGINVLFTVGLIIVSDNFSKETQALAGAVFSTASQFGTSLGVGVCQVVALGVMGDLSSEGATSGNASDMLRGYRASFWAMFASMVLCILISIVGLRRTGKVGLKKD